MKGPPRLGGSLAVCLLVILLSILPVQAEVCSCFCCDSEAECGNSTFSLKVSSCSACAQTQCYIFLGCQKSNFIRAACEDSSGVFNAIVIYAFLIITTVLIVFALSYNHVASIRACFEDTQPKKTPSLRRLDSGTKYGDEPGA